jgi:hypothetical protein
MYSNSAPQQTQQMEPLPQRHQQQRQQQLAAMSQKCEQGNDDNDDGHSEAGSDDSLGMSQLAELVYSTVLTTNAAGEVLSDVRCSLM